MKWGRKRKPVGPTRSEIVDYVYSLKVDHPGWLWAYYMKRPDDFPNPTMDSLARDLKLEPLEYPHAKATGEVERSC